MKVFEIEDLEKIDSDDLIGLKILANDLDQSYHNDSFGLESERIDRIEVDITSSNVGPLEQLIGVEAGLYYSRKRQEFVMF